jgi:hypothetical protein
MLDDNQLIEEMGNLSRKEQTKFMKLLETFNHRGGSSSNSKANTALRVAKYNSSSNSNQRGGGLFSGITNMFGGVSEQFTNLKNFATPSFLKDINNELDEKNNTDLVEKMEGGKFNNNKLEKGTTIHDDTNELEERVSKLETSLSLLNDTLTHINDNENLNEKENNNINVNNNPLKGGGKVKKVKNSNKRYKKTKSKNKVKPKSKSINRKRKSNKSKKLK